MLIGIIPVANGKRDDKGLLCFSGRDRLILVDDQLQIKSIVTEKESIAEYREKLKTDDIPDIRHFVDRWGEECHPDKKDRFNRYQILLRTLAENEIPFQLPLWKEYKDIAQRTHRCPSCDGRGVSMLDTDMICLSCNGRQFVCREDALEIMWPLVKIEGEKGPNVTDLLKYYSINNPPQPLRVVI